MKIHVIKVLSVVVACLLALCTLPVLAAEGAQQEDRQLLAGKAATQMNAGKMANGQRAWASASKEARESWRKSLSAAPRPAHGCFRAEFPDSQWHEVPCDHSPRKLRLPGGGGGVQLETVGGPSGDVTAQVPGGITQAEGSFDSVVTAGASDSLVGAGMYSLQINTEQFDTSVCSGAGAGSTCKGWEQFVFDYDGTTSMQYWLIDYGPPGYTCPAPHHVGVCSPGYVYTDGWCEIPLYGRTYCAANSPVVIAAAAAPTALASVNVQGRAAVGGSSDSFVANVGGAAATATGDNFFPDLSTKWHHAEFNVFGYGNSSTVNFDPNSTLVVRVGVDSGAAIGPGCNFESFTAETNNLSITNTTITPLHNGHPSLIFTESNVGTPSPSCAVAISIGDTHITTFDGVHYDFQAAGEFLLADVDEFTVQARQGSGAPLWPNTSVNKALAVRMGKTRIEFYVEPSSVEVDGKTPKIDDGQAILLGDGVQILRQGNVYTASDKHGNRVRATLNSSWLNASVLVVAHAGHAPGKIRGLLGNPAGNGKSLVASTGKRFAAPMAFNDLYGVFGSSWRVQPKQSLFRHKSSLKFALPARPFFAEHIQPEAAARARAVCEQEGVKDKNLMEDCVLDTAVLNDKAAAQAFVVKRREFPTGMQNDKAAARKPMLLRTVIKPVFTEPGQLK